MFCPNCGKQIDDEARFCPYCGGSTTGDPAASQEQWRVPGQRKRSVTQLINEDWGEPVTDEPVVSTDVSQDQYVPDNVVGPNTSGYSVDPTKRGSGSLLDNQMAVAGLAAACTLLLALGFYFLFLRAPKPADDQLVGYFAVNKKAKDSDYEESMAISVDRNGVGEFYILDRHFLGDVVHVGKFQESEEYRVDNIRFSNGVRIDGLSLTIAAPRGASNGTHEGVWAYCLHDERKGKEVLKSWVVTIQEDGEARLQHLKNKDVFDMEWKYPKRFNQTWRKIEDKTYQLTTTETGFIRELTFPA